MTHFQKGSTDLSATVAAARGIGEGRGFAGEGLPERIAEARTFWGLGCLAIGFGLHALLNYLRPNS